MSHVVNSYLISVTDYLAGEVFTMAGASEEHVTIAGNIFALLRSHLRGCACRVYIADMKLHIATANSFFYPDVFVTCDTADARERQLKRAPTVIIEVLSKTTENDDRGIKFAHYRQLPNLRDYVLIDSRRRAIEIYSRQDNDWLFQPLASDAPLVIPSLQFSCRADQVYEDVQFALLDDN
ncbi:Uma2 family endonuclease [Thiospirillum jenense]|uniref:Uma2 family endonuclease n=1 Tax=Thiospirillum jenense TaxID=1653858 RepID=A0A839HJL3_9GAMM|nr:Uma2 family endonuclease [Thiospirillum jenense]MBB1126152.1 Uma2 family endonuclease [Thiospirillum jenense]